MERWMFDRGERERRDGWLIEGRGEKEKEKDGR